MTTPHRYSVIGRGTSLAGLVASLGPTLVHVLTAPAGETVPVLRPRLFDAADPAAVEPGDLVLGVNLVPSRVVGVLSAAAAAGAAAVALKGTTESLAGAVTAAADAGVALVAVSPDVSWDHLYGLARNAVDLHPRPGDGQEEPPLRDLFAVANALAAVVGGAVTIEDQGFNLLAYSNLDQPIDEPRRETILGRGLPGTWAQRLEDGGILQQLVSTEAVLRIPDADVRARPRMASAIRAGGELLGSVWVVQGDAPLGPETETALREAIPLLALHLLRHRASEDMSRRERGVLLRALLEGSGSATVVGTALGIDPADCCAVVGFRLVADDDLDLSLQRVRAVDMISVACEAFRRRVVCTWVGDTVYALFPAVDVDTAPQLTALVQTIAQRSLHSLGSTLYAGVGSPVEQLHDAHRSRAEADRILRVLTSGAGATRTVAGIDEVRVPGILLELGDLIRANPQLRLPAIDAIAAYDAAHSKSYLDTLRAYVTAYGDVTVAGSLLTLHPNSVRYRVKRLEELFGLDLSDPLHLLVIRLQFLGGPTSA